jgi:hypothetical protein
MRRFSFIGMAALAGGLIAQQTTQNTTSYSVDLNGRRVESTVASHAVTPGGGQRVETVRNMNGRNVPIEYSEDKVLSDDARGNRTLERVVRRFDQNGNPTPGERVRIEEKVNPDGSRTIQKLLYRDDINGRPQVAERETTQVRESGSTTQTTVMVERSTINGALEVVQKASAVERKTSNGSTLESTTYRRDLNGSFNPAASEQISRTKQGNAENVDSNVYELGPDNKLQLTTRTVGTITTKADGSQVEQLDVYSTRTGPATLDTNTVRPRLQQQVLRERNVKSDGTVVEVTSVRDRLPTDPNRFGNYERVAETTIVATDASGRKVTQSSKEVERRTPNGEVKPAEATATTVITVPKR